MRTDCESSVDGKCKLLGGNCTETCGIPAGRAKLDQKWKKAMK